MVLLSGGSFGDDLLLVPLICALSSCAKKFHNHCQDYLSLRVIAMKLL